MNPLLLALPILLIGAYLAVSVRLLLQLVNRGGNWRDLLRAAARVEPGQVLRAGWISIAILLVGLGVLVLASTSFSAHLAYDSAPECGSTPGPDCRQLTELQVSRVDIESSKSGEETVVHFLGPYDSATFWADDVPPSAVRPETSVMAEVWHGDVTALVLGGKRHQSFATQADSWIGIAAGIGAVLIGLAWLASDIATESLLQQIEPVHEVFQSPVGRRIALCVLVPLFGALLIVFGFAYLAIALGAFDMANTLANIYLVGAVLSLPFLVGVFVAWFYRVYMNVHALGLRVKHSGWFVAASLLVPPLSLYMPYRLAREMALATNARMTGALLKAWWACAVGWLGFTIAGLSLGSADPRDASLTNQLSNGLLVASVALGLIGAGLTIRLVVAMDAAERGLARGR